MGLLGRCRDLGGRTARVADLRPAGRSRSARSGRAPRRPERHPRHRSQRARARGRRPRPSRTVLLRDARPTATEPLRQSRRGSSSANTRGSGSGRRKSGSPAARAARTSTTRCTSTRGLRRGGRTPARARPRAARGGLQATRRRCTSRTRRQRRRSSGPGRAPASRAGRSGSPESLTGGPWTGTRAFRAEAGARTPHDRPRTSPRALSVVERTSCSIRGRKPRGHRYGATEVPCDRASHGEAGVA